MKKSLSILSLVLSAVTVMTGCDGVGADATFSQTSAALEVSTCGSIVAPIMVKNSAGVMNIPAANVSLTNNTTDLVFTIVANPLEGYEFQDILVFAGTGQIPTDPVGGWQDFQQFPYGASFNPTVTSQTVSIPLSSILVGDPVGQTVNVAVYVVMVKKDTNGNIIDVAKGWSHGENYTGCGCYGIAYPYVVCGGTVPETGCTFTQGYWKTHYETARNRSQRVNWPSPMDESQLLCTSDSRTLLTIIGANSTGGNAYQILARQWIAAKLNLANGASSTEQVDAALDLGKALLDQYCGQTVHASTADGQLMTILGSVLDGFNNGLTGPGHCN